MSRNEELIKEAERLMREQPEDASERIDEIVKELEATDSPEQRQMVSDMLHRQLDITEKNLMEIGHELMREQIDDELYKLIPWSYIARTYFHKEPSWLHQRINGSPVRGKVYTLNEEQKQTLNRALADVGQKIGSYRFA
ncbi:MAG: DUF5053 domain-containing protein [Prevotella sp.]|nr:DUF5053 domain-containing protein [Prevotella sp.]